MYNFKSIRVNKLNQVVYELKTNSVFFFNKIFILKTFV